jgi:hypothetical protein
MFFITGPIAVDELWLLRRTKRAMECLFPEKLGNRISSFSFAITPSLLLETCHSRTFICQQVTTMNLSQFAKGKYLRSHFASKKGWIKRRNIAGFPLKEAVPSARQKRSDARRQRFYVLWRIFP